MKSVPTSQWTGVLFLADCCGTGHFGRSAGPLVAGYTEVALPDLIAGHVDSVALAYRNPDFSPKNRAWLPLGPYLRTKTGPLPLPPGEAGVRIGKSAFRQAGNFAGLPLIPQPESWTANVESLCLR